MLVLDVEPDVVDVLLRDGQLVLPLLVLRIVLHALHLAVIALLVLVALHHLVVGEGAAVEIRLVHLHRVHLREVATAGQNVHVEHRAAAAVRRCARVRHASEALAMHADSEAARHRTVHLLVEVHHVQRVAQLLLMHEYIGSSRIALIDHHIVDAHLALSSALLGRHWHVIGLIHSVLVRGALVMAADLTGLALRILRFRVRILHDLVHVYLVPHRWRRLRVLLRIAIAAMIVEVVRVLHSRELVALPVVNIVLASARGRASWIGIDAADAIV